jgi:hypothetical protein
MENSNQPNEEQINQQFNQQFGNLGREQLPNSTAVLILGISSIALCWCYGFVAIICGIVALVMANKDMELYNKNPQAYTEASYANLKGGRVCAIIGLCFAGLVFITLIVLAVAGLASLAFLDKLF